MKEAAMRFKPRLIVSAVIGLLVAIGISACGGDGSSGGGDGSGGGGDPSGSGRGSSSTLPQGGERVQLNPADFTTRIDNRYWPMSAGSRWVYRETDAAGAKQKVVVTVTDRTKMIANGIEARVVHDLVTENGQYVENTYDWYAQDAEGNIWYLGEDTTEYKNGKPDSTAGSWEAGVDGAQAGVALPTDPQVGMHYRQEYYKGQAEDEGKVLSVTERAEAPFGRFSQVLLTRDTTPLEPNLVEHKFYAKNVGPVLATTISGGSDREELLSYRAGG
jgi:hypothetical protein